MLTLLILVAGGTCQANNDLPPVNGIANGELSTSVNYNSGRLSISAKDVVIVELMRQVGDEANFEVIAYGDLEEQTGTWSFSDLPLIEAIRKLLRGTNSIVTYETVEPAGGEPVVSKIYLLGSNTASLSPIRIQTVETDLDSQLRSSQALDGDIQERIAAIDRTVGLTDKITLENLAFALRHDPDPDVRIKAVSALENIGGSAAVTAISGGMGDLDSAVRKKVVQAFAKLDDERIPMWLGRVLMGDTDAEVRLESVRAIAQKDGDTARIFLQAATGDNSELVSEAALQLSR